MGRLSRALTVGTRRSAENPSVPIDAAFDGLGMGPSWGGGRVSGDPYRIAVALRCVRIISAMVAGSPVRVTDLSTRMDATALVPALSSLRPGQTPFELWSTVVAHMALRGNAYCRKVRNRYDEIIDLVPIHPDRITLDVVDRPAGQPGLPYMKVFTLATSKGTKKLGEDDVLHIPGLADDGVRGLSTIELYRRGWHVASAGEAAAAGMFEGGLVQPGMLTTDQTLTDDQARSMSKRWAAGSAGISNIANPPVLSNGTKYVPITISPADAQWLDSRKYSVTEIARLFGVPGWLVNDQEKSTSWGSGIDSMFTAFVIVTLSEYAKRIEQRLRREVVPDPEQYDVQFDFRAQLRGDPASRAAYYNAGITGGWLVPNDVRDYEELPRVEWGDVPYLPHNTSAAQQGQGSPAGGTP